MVFDYNVEKKIAKDFDLNFFFLKKWMMELFFYCFPFWKLRLSLRSYSLQCVHMGIKLLDLKILAALVSREL